MPATDTPIISVCTLAAAVVACMPGWALAGTSRDANDSDQWAHLRHTETGAEISLSLTAWPRPVKIHVSGVWPRRTPRGAYGEFMPRDSTPHAINVSPDKGAPQIARDILRRLAPAFLVEYAVQAARMTATLAREGTAREAAQRIANSIGETTRPAQGASDPQKIWLSNIFRERRGTGAVTVFPNEDVAYVDVELHGITPDEAIAILAALRRR